MSPTLEDCVSRIVELYDKCGSVLVLAGAGMGVASGIGTFRGETAGVWEGLRRYEALPVAPDGSTGLSQLNCAKWFDQRPVMAWDFWRWCHNGYTDRTPHSGYTALRNLITTKQHFVVTTNIDSHFAKSGFDTNRLRELHGVVRRIRCSGFGREKVERVLGTEEDLRPLDFAEDYEVGEMWRDGEPCDYVGRFEDLEDDEVPRCDCGAVLRPDVTLFGDLSFPSQPPPGPHLEQHQRYTTFLEEIRDDDLLILEIGAGTVHDTLRKLSSGEFPHASLVRINTTEAEVEEASSILSVPYDAKEVLEAVWEKVAK